MWHGSGIQSQGFPVDWQVSSGNQSNEASLLWHRLRGDPAVRIQRGLQLPPIINPIDRSMSRNRLLIRLCGLLVLIAVMTGEGGHRLITTPPMPPTSSGVSQSPAAAELFGTRTNARLAPNNVERGGGDLVHTATAWPGYPASQASESNDRRVIPPGIETAVFADSAATIGSVATGVNDFTEDLKWFTNTHNIGAAALGIMNQGKIVYNEAVGFMDAERQVPVKRDIMMRLASVTKPITAAAIHKLARDGMLALDDHVFNLGQSSGGLLQISPFPGLGDARLADITVRHLLLHRGGWDRQIAGDLAFRETEIAHALSVPSPPGRDNTVRYVLGQSLQFTPGGRYAYSNIGYLILGLVIEAVSGKDYLTYVHENIFDPLGVPRDDVIQGRTFPEDRSDREPWYDGGLRCTNVFDPSGLAVWCPDGGWDHEAKIAHGGLVASTRAILAFLNEYVAFGNSIGRLRTGTEGPNWWAAHSGSLSGTNTLAWQRGTGINYVILFNRRRSSSGSSYVSMFSDILERKIANYTVVRFEGVIADLAFTQGVAVPAVTLPPALGGLPPYTYRVDPPLPAGLAFDETTQSISGVPTQAAPGLSYTYSVTGSLESTASLAFSLYVAAAVSFGDAIADQSYLLSSPVAPLVLPEAAGGVAPIDYTVSPELPTSLTFDSATRTISGTPTVITSAPIAYTYKATDVNGSADSLQFSIEVQTLVATEHEAWPESFAVRGNYPNPFRDRTQIVFDLPRPARVLVEVLDLTGRRVLAVPPTDMAAGWNHEITVSGETLPSGVYLYQLRATSPEGQVVHSGRFVRVR